MPGASVVAAIAVNRPEKLEEIAPLHIWTAESVQCRPARLPAQAPADRAGGVGGSPLAEPVRLARTPDYRGCASWVQLPVTPDWAGPVHDDANLLEIAERVRGSVG